MAGGRNVWQKEVSDGIAITDHDFNLLSRDINNKEKSCKIMKEHIHEKESKIKILKENLERLEREHENLSAIEDIEKKTCTSQDAHKMFGDVVPRDTIRKDVALSFKDYFNKAFRHLPKSLEESDEGKHKIWEMTCDIVQECFKQNKEEIIKEMIEELETALLGPPLTNKSLDDKTADLYKAFHVFVTEVLIKKERGSSCDIGKKIKDDLKQKLQSQGWSRRYLTDDIELATNILTKHDPEDYSSIIYEGKKREKHYYSGSQRKDVVCFACKGKFKIDNNDFPIEHLGQHWHKHHYNCHRCQKVIDCENFIYIKDHDIVYCRSCSCSKCGYAIAKEYIHDEDGLVYHPACVRCHYCNTIGSIKLEHICINCGRKH